MNITSKKSRINGNKVVSVFVNGSLHDSYVDQVTLTYGRLGEVTGKVVTAETQAADAIYNLNRRLNNKVI